MANNDSNVVAFETPQSKQQKDRTKLNDNGAIDGCRTIFSDRLTELMEGFFTRVDDELFKLSDKADNSTLQSLYFESMRYVRRERESILQKYLQRLLQQYDDFWLCRTPFCSESPVTETNLIADDSFSLVENETLEEDLAINSMIGKGNSLFHHDLFALTKRFAALISKDEGQIEPYIPVFPAALCRGFESELKSLTLDLKIKLLIYKLFERSVLSEMGAVYHELNRHLIQEGILPSIARPIKRHPVTPSQNMRTDLGQTPSQPRYPTDRRESSSNAAYVEAFKSMQDLLDGWRRELGVPDHCSGPQADAMILESCEVVDALSALQHPATLATVGNSSLASDALKLVVTNQLNKRGRARHMGRLEGDIIDMVSMIFDFILEDRNLSSPIKALIARLQIPIVKVAILDTAFFGRKTHPARMLLNSLAQAGIGLDVADNDSDNLVFKKIEDIVGRILCEFDQDIYLFDELLKDFSAFIAKESQRNRIVEERTRQVTQSKEHVKVAKKQVAYEIASRVRGKQTPSIIKSFLYNTWKDVLVLAYLRQDKDPANWNNALAVIDKLICTAETEKPNVGEDTVLAIPALWGAIKDGLESISLDPQQVVSLLDDLRACRMNGLCGDSHPFDESAVRPMALPHPEPVILADTHTNEEVIIDDTEIAEAILEIKANLPEIEELETHPPGAECSEKSTGPKQWAGECDEFLRQARGLNIGEWVEFTDDGQSPRRAKLSWKSQVTSLYIFVNRKGIKVSEINVRDLADRLRQGTARIIDSPATPLMDRALAALMQSLKNPRQTAEMLA